MKQNLYQLSCASFWYIIKLYTGIPPVVLLLLHKRICKTSTCFGVLCLFGQWISFVYRRSASLEFIPNRFKLPQQKSFLPSQSSFNDSLPSSPRSPTTPRKVAPPPPRKPQPYPKVSRAPEEDTTTPYLVHLPHQNMPGQPPTYHNRETSQGGSSKFVKNTYCPFLCMTYCYNTG